MGYSHLDLWVSNFSSLDFVLILQIYYNISLYIMSDCIEKLYTVSKNKTGSWLWLRSWTPYYQIQTSEVGKTTRPFRYDLNQIPYDYTVEVRNRFKGLDLIDREPGELYIDGGSWHCTENRDQDHPQENEIQKSKTVVCGGLTNSCEKMGSKKQKEKRKDIPIGMQSSKG